MQMLFDIQTLFLVNITQIHYVDTAGTTTLRTGYLSYISIAQIANA